MQYKVRLSSYFPWTKPDSSDSGQLLKTNSKHWFIFLLQEEGAGKRVTLRTFLSCTFLQPLPELVTPPFISAQLSTDAVSALPKVWVLIQLTLRASLSGTFRQTLPDLVTPLMAHSLSPCTCTPKGLGTNITVEAT